MVSEKNLIIKAQMRKWLIDYLYRKLKRKILNETK